MSITLESEKVPEFEIGDVVQILDGAEVPDYFGTFVSSMQNIVGQIGVISDFLGERDGYKGYRVRKVSGDLYRFIFDSRGLKKTNLHEPTDFTPDMLKEILGTEIIIK